ncbi:hypothetical protein HX99_06005 [Peptococcaceae bacterium SCADC1_2_3]|nr:hypothetical protein DK28_0213745 [Peptococcaceae bacterium SCADC1_2_3]KFI35423.1 hypothetical protein HX99_06005 [Peptococcaceae bacterium SCADC1_2_3]HBQ29137.1 VWA domain-containing protein [Desulfotomaculum sp.]
MNDTSAALAELTEKIAFSKPGWVFEGYSDFWRKNKSNLEAEELANILRALRKVAGHIGMNVGNVEWAGLPGRERVQGVITLDPSFVIRDYPLPPGKMDVLVGIVVHEAYRNREWSDLVWSKIEAISPKISYLDKDLLWKMFLTGENIYLNKLAEKNTLGLYVQKARKVLFAPAAKDYSLSPTAPALFDLWWRKVLDAYEAENINSLYLEPLNKLVARTDDLVCIGDEKISVSEKCRQRSVFYLSLWEEIKALIIPWKKEKITYFATWKEDGDKKEKEKVKKKKGTPTAKKPISLQLGAEIEESLAVGSSDITPLVKAICGEAENVIRTTVWDFTIPAHPMIDPYLVARLKAVFQTYAHRVKVVNRGLKNGSIDQRRLYRAHISGNCFMLKQFIPEEAWNITLLIDASQSMAGPKWQLVENTISSLFKALEGQKNKLQAYGYLEHDGVCIVSELLRRGKLYSLPPHGRTPSGQAIIAAALLMPKEKKQRLIIHITDGESNCGCDVEYGLKYCKKERIDLVTLGCGYKDKDVLVKQYGKHLQFLDYFEQLPKALEALLRRKLLAS